MSVCLDCWIYGGLGYWETEWLDVQLLNHCV